MQSWKAVVVPFVENIESWKWISWWHVSDTVDFSRGSEGPQIFRRAKLKLIHLNYQDEEKLLGAAGWTGKGRDL